MSSETILVVDDDDDLRESIVEILEDNSFSVKGCSSAEQALADLKHRKVQLVIVDKMMPGMGGMALLPLLKKDYPRLKVIMITAFSTVEGAVLAMKSGVDDYLPKPFRRDELLVAVRRNLETLKFDQQMHAPEMDDALACLSHQIRRQILGELHLRREMKFMDLTRRLGVKDHTKVNFHLKNLKANNLIEQDRDKRYFLTPLGSKMVDCLHLMSREIHN